MKFTFLFPVVFLFCSLLCLAQDTQSLNGEKSISVLRQEIGNRDLPQNDLISTLNELGELYYGENADSARYFLKRALNLNVIRNDSVAIADSYINLSIVGLFHGEYDETLKYTDSAFLYVNKKNRKHFQNVGLASSIAGIVHNNQENMDLAFERILEANRFLSKAPDNEETRSYLAESYSDLALIYFNLDNYEDAIKSSTEGLRRAKLINDERSVADGYDILAASYTAMEEYGMAEKYLDSAEAAFTKIDFTPGLLSVQSDKGRLYLAKKEYSKANSQFQKTLKMGKESNDNYIQTAILLDLGKLAFENNQLGLSKKYIDSAEVTSMKTPGSMFSNEIALAKSKILRDNKNYNEAIEIIKDNIAHVKAENLRESEKVAYEELYELYKEKGDMENSFLYFEKFTQLNDTLREELQNSRINVLRVEHNYNELVADLETTEAQLQIASEAQKRIKLRNYFTIGIAGLIILFAIFGFFRQRKLNRVRRSVLESKQEILKVKQEALDNKVQFKNKQITDFAIHISEKNELLEKIKSKLKGIKVINDTYKDMVNDTLHFINNDIEQNKEKIQLYQQVNETNDSFRAKIDQMYTTLSDKEKKVATMLRLGQTSKQIALQLNISAASVDNYRYTLRKKMNIPKGESLKMFIQNI